MLNSQSAKLNHIHNSNVEDPLFQSILEISDEAVFILNMSDFSIIDCNKAAIKLFEASSKATLVSLPLFRLFNIQPLDSTIEKVNAELEEKGNCSQELSFKTIKQNIFWGKLIQKNVSFANSSYTLVKVSKSANYLREEEWLSEVLKITSKVTGRKFFKELTSFLCRTFNAEYAFIARRVADESRLKIFYWHGDKINQYYIPIKNSFIENTLHGVTSYYPEVLGELFPKDDIIKATATKSFMGTPIFDPSGQTFGVIGILSKQSMEELPNSRYMLSILSSRTASELHRLSSKELLRQQTRELAEINQMKDKLLSVITSDLHAPLSTILGFSDILKRNLEDYSANQLAGKLKVMDNTLRNLHVFLENLTDWNKLLQSEVKAELGDVYVSSIIEETKSDYAYLSDLKHVSIQSNIKESKHVVADSYLTSVAVRNTAAYLIKNTMKHSSIEYNCCDNGSSQCLSVKSENFTADEEDIKFCLESSVQELYSASKDSSVPVLGLFIAREFMKLQGGSLTYAFKGNELELRFLFCK